MFILFTLTFVIAFIVSTEGDDFAGKFALFCLSFLVVFVILSIGVMCYQAQFGGLNV